MRDTLEARSAQRLVCALAGLALLLGGRPVFAGPGDVGSPECGGLHWSLQQTLGAPPGPEGRAGSVRPQARRGVGGAYEQAAWNRVGAAMQAGRITGACSECIIKQFYARIPFAAQRPCGPFPTPTPTPEPEPTATPPQAAGQTPGSEAVPEVAEDDLEAEDGEDDRVEEVDLFEEVPLYEE